MTKRLIESDEDAVDIYLDLAYLGCTPAFYKKGVYSASFNDDGSFVIRLSYMGVTLEEEHHASTDAFAKFYDIID